MSQFDEKLLLFNSENRKLNLGLSERLIREVAKKLGPSIYNKDASTVSCSGESEMNTVKKNFLIKKLGLPDNSNLDSALKEVCQKMGTSNRNKYRALFYAMLVRKFGKESVYN